MFISVIFKSRLAALHDAEALRSGIRRTGRRKTVPRYVKVEMLNWSKLQTSDGMPG